MHCNVSYNTRGHELEGNVFTDRTHYMASMAFTVIVVWDCMGITVDGVHPAVGTA